MNLDRDLIYCAASFADRDALFDTLAQDLIERGYVKEDYSRALKEREASFPTGLPIPGGVAIPHTDASHVLKDTIAVVTLAEPLEFGEMGGAPDDVVKVSLVLLLVLADAAGHVKFLSTTIKAIQDAEFVLALTSSTSVDTIMHVIANKLSI